MKFMTKTTFLKGMVAAGAISLAVSPANAATLDLTGAAGEATELTFTDGTVTLTTKAQRMRVNGTVGGHRILTQTADGLGVKTGPNDSDQLDNTVQDEAIKFLFSTAVKIEKIFFSFVDDTDVFSLSVLAGKTVTSFFDGLDIDGNGIGSFTLGSSVFADSFAIGVIGDGVGVKISGIEYSLEEPAPVPLPAAGWLLLAGLGGLAVARRKKRAA